MNWAFFFKGIPSRADNPLSYTRQDFNPNDFFEDQDVLEEVSMMSRFLHSEKHCGFGDAWVWLGQAVLPFLGTSLGASLEGQWLGKVRLTSFSKIIAVRYNGADAFPSSTTLCFRCEQNIPQGHGESRCMNFIGGQWLGRRDKFLLQQNLCYWNFLLASEAKGRNRSLQAIVNFSPGTAAEDLWHRACLQRNTPSL